MANIIEANGYDEFVKAVEELKGRNGPIYVFFAGSNGDDGMSWCSDCVAAHPVVYSAMKHIAPKNSHFIHVQVGDKTTWKDRNCIFRKSPLTRLTVLPTLRRWGTPYIIREAECQSKELVELLINEEPTPDTSQTTTVIESVSTTPTPVDAVTRSMPNSA